MCGDENEDVRKDTTRDKVGTEIAYERNAEFEEGVS